MTLSDPIRTVFTGGHIYCSVRGDEFIMLVKGRNGYSFYEKISG